jgi:hypothetical protein
VSLCFSGPLRTLAAGAGSYERNRGPVDSRGRQLISLDNKIVRIESRVIISAQCQVNYRDGKL